MTIKNQKNSLYKLYKDTWIRTNEHAGTDRGMVRDCLRSYSNFNLSDSSKVLDLGANIGGFAVMCKNSGVLDYTAVEADRDNYNTLLENTKDTNYNIIHGACSSLNEETVTFYLRNSKQCSCSGTIAPKTTKNLRDFTVDNYHIDSLISKYSPDCLKIDIEGAEKDILKHLNGVIPECVNELALEIHTSSYIKYFESDIHPLILEHFELVSSCPSDGFKNNGNDWIHFGVSRNSVLFGYDLFYRRK